MTMPNRDITVSQIDMQALETLAKSIPEEDRDIATDTYYFGLIFREYLLQVVDKKSPNSKISAFVKNDIFYRALLIGAIPLFRFGISRITQLMSRR